MIFSIKIFNLFASIIIVMLLFCLPPLKFNMTSETISTRDKLMSLVDDLELIAKELIENTVTLRNQKMTSSEHSQLTELLISKDNEIKSALGLARNQAIVEKKMDMLRAEIELHDQEIRNLQKQLKEGEQILAAAIFQAKQKLASISKANKRPILSEELIKFAHRISASNAVCAPLTWQQGDPRRPYPTDIEMRLGFLGRLSDLPLNGHLLQQQGLSDFHRTGHASGGEPPASQPHQFAWHPSGEIHMSVGSQGSVTMDTRNHKDNEDVEVMSTDSSSSSSSDSQ